MRFLLGFAIGFGLGVLMAPASGAETRDKIAQRIRDVAEIPRQKAEKAAEAAKQRVGELGSRVGREVAEAAVDAVEKDVLGQNKTA
jgi:gas vesicle protein